MFKQCASWYAAEVASIVCLCCQLLKPSIMAVGATEAANAAIAAAINGGGRRKSTSNGKPVTRSSSGRKRSSDTQAGGNGEHEGFEQSSGGSLGLPKRPQYIKSQPLQAEQPLVN